MKLKIYIILFLLCFNFSTRCIAKTLQGWKVYSDKTIISAKNTALPELTVPLKSAGGTPKILEWNSSPMNPKIWVLTYHAGVAGTSHFYEITRAVLVDTLRNKILGDAPLKYIPIDDAPALTQPQWEWSKVGLIVKDISFNENLKLHWEIQP